MELIILVPTPKLINSLTLPYMIFDSSRNHYSSSSYLPRIYPNDDNRLPHRSTNRVTIDSTRLTMFDDRPSSELRIRCDQRRRSKDPHIESVKNRDGAKICGKRFTKKTIFSTRTFLRIAPCVYDRTRPKGSRCNVCIYIYINVR